MQMPERKPVSDAATSPTNITIKLDSIIDVKDLISDIKGACKLAKRTGGTYYVYRENDKGEKAIFEICVPFSEVR